MEPHSTRWLGAAALLAAVVQIAACKSETTALPALGAELGATSVSGLSAGAYMAGQFQIAHSSIVRGCRHHRRRALRLCRKRLRRCDAWAGRAVPQFVEGHERLHA